MDSSQTPATAPTAPSAPPSTPAIFGITHAQTDEQKQRLQKIHKDLKTCLEVPVTNIEKRRQAGILVLKTVYRTERMFDGSESPSYKRVIFTYGVQALKAILEAVYHHFSIPPAAFTLEKYPDSLRSTSRPQPTTEDPKDLWRWIILKQLGGLELRDHLVKAADKMLEFCLSDFSGRIVHVKGVEEVVVLLPVANVDAAWRAEMLQYVQYAMNQLACWLSFKFGNAMIKLDRGKVIRHVTRQEMDQGNPATGSNQSM